MSMPGFTAAHSLYNPGQIWNFSSSAVKRNNSELIPQAGFTTTRRASTLSCILTSDGGKWCCIQGSKGPICWKFPPPIIIAALR